MKKKIIYDAASGFPMGIAVGFLFSLIVSVLIGDGSFYPVMPELAVKTGSELNAVILQTVLCGALGSVFKGASIVWELESWSLLKQTGVYFAIGCAAMAAAAYTAGWMHSSILGALFFITAFCVIFVLIWIVQYFLWKRKVEQINERLKKGGAIQQND